MIFDDGLALTCLKFDKETGMGSVSWELHDYQNKFRKCCNKMKPISAEDKEQLQEKINKELARENTMDPLE